MKYFAILLVVSCVSGIHLSNTSTYALANDSTELKHYNFKLGYRNVIIKDESASQKDPHIEIEFSPHNFGAYFLQKFQHTQELVSPGSFDPLGPRNYWHKDLDLSQFAEGTPIGDLVRNDRFQTLLNFKDLSGWGRYAQLETFARDVFFTVRPLV
ncbi:MAG: hypothetical protein AB1540_16095, partial [Bdellovibrionota bacterium]